jgi:3-methyladenine DNA glycosylase/8-oxoguanine DNA glycosylase
VTEASARCRGRGRFAALAAWVVLVFVFRSSDRGGLEMLRSPRPDLRWPPARASYNPFVGRAGRTLRSAEPIDVGLTFGPLARGGRALSSVLTGDRWTHAMHSPAGPVTLSVQMQRADAMVTVEAWGAGREWVMEHAPAIVGVRDAPHSFRPTNALVAALHRRLPGLRVIRLGTVYDVAVATTIEQRVTTLEARRSWRALVRRYGEPAPGPHGLVLPPSPRSVANLPDWEWRRIGIEGRRAATMRNIARDASGLDRAAAVTDTVLENRLLGTRGVGPWTSAHVMHVVAGDADAVPVGDWHLPRHVGFALAGEPRADDERMLELLEPFRPHRARVWRLLMAGTRPPPRRAPRARIHELMRAEAARR